MTRRGWLLFATLSVCWGIPYLFIRVAVADLDPLIVAFGRTAIGALLRLPLAGGIVFRTSGTWPRTKALFCYQVSADEWPADPDIVELAALRFALVRCARRGMPLRAGQLVSTGAATGIHDIRAGQRARVTFDAIGEIAVVATLAMPRRAP